MKELSIRDERFVHRLVADLYSADSCLVQGRFRAYATAKGHGGSILPFIAVAAGAKPAMDDWVPIAHYNRFVSACQSFGVKVKPNAYFLAADVERMQHAVGYERLTTTRAFVYQLNRHAPANGEVHVFLSRDADALECAFANGWYSALVHDRLVDKPLPDHPRFGAALGYPTCCIRFFEARNDWQTRNFYYEINKQSDQRSWFLNCCARLAGLSYIFHMPCSFGCEESRSRAEHIRQIAHEEEPALSSHIDMLLQLPVLCLSERNLYVLNGELIGSHRCRYSEVYGLPPTWSTENAGSLLMRGSELEIDGHIIYVLRSGKQIGVYEARCDQVGPELPLLFSWN